MTYASYDQSVEDGSPIECYLFTGTGGTWRYTDADEEVTVDGLVYQPLSGIERTTVEVGSLIDSRMTIDIQLPVDSDLAQKFAFLKTQDSLNVEIRSVHRGSNFATEWRMEWQGITLFYTSSGRITSIQTGTAIQSAVQARANSIYYQTTCNHVLFDERCKVLRGDHTTTSVVTAIEGNEITVADDGVANNDLRAGEVKNLRTGERRFVLGNSLNVIDIGFPFDDLILGDEVEMVKGCIHTFSECNVKFANLDNFGGFMYVPSSNPFEDGGL